MAAPLFERILIATDGSEKNSAALNEGLAIARACNAYLWAVYVIDTRPIMSAGGDFPVGDTYRMYHAEAEKALSRVKDLAGEIKVEPAVLEGNPATEIVRFASAKNIDLIVIATQGKKGLERLLLGSVAEEIIRSAHCKVLVVK